MENNKIPVVTCMFKFRQSQNAQETNVNLDYSVQEGFYWYTKSYGEGSFYFKVMLVHVCGKKKSVLIMVEV